MAASKRSMAFMNIRAVLIILFFACNALCCRSPLKPVVATKPVLIQPFTGVDTALLQQLFSGVQKVHPGAKLLAPVDLPASAFSASRNRYRADSLLKQLSAIAGSNTVAIGITNKDISTTKKEHKDWGVMGLGYEPGNACIVSCFRLQKSNLQSQFYKVALHELGHTAGLPHCEVDSCFMRDAKGGNPINSEKDFCSNCKLFLINKGWRLE